MTRKKETDEVQQEEVLDQPVQLVTENQLINAKLDHIIKLLETPKE